MRILVAYNRYKQRIHGEEVVVDNLIRLLRANGHSVGLYTRSSEGLVESTAARVAAGLSSLYNPFSRADFGRVLDRDRPEVVHAHNLYPWLSPSILAAASKRRVPVVLTIHHYGLSCPVLTHFRDGQICLKCSAGSQINAIRNNCRGSLLESALYAARHALADRLRLFKRHVSRFIVLSEFARTQLIEAGFDGARISVRPNMVFEPQETLQRGNGAYIAYVGRITAEKGLETLCEAALKTALPVRIAGDLQMWPELQAKYAGIVRFEGVLRGNSLEEFYRNARFVVVPSLWWEICPIVVLEAMSFGVPVLASDLGGLPELLDQGRAGALFHAGDTADLARWMTRLWNDESLREQLAKAGRRRVGERYTEKSYLPDTLAIYRHSIENPAFAL